MNNIHDMRRRRGEIWDRAKAFLGERQDENGMLSAEDTAQYERMEQEVVDLGHAIERAERADALEREMNAPTASPLASRPEARPNQRTGRGSDEYKSAFWTAMRKPRRPFFRAERAADRHRQRGRLPRPRRVRAHAGGRAAGGKQAAHAVQDHPHRFRRPQDPAGGFPRHGQLGRGGRYDPRIRRRLRADHHRGAQDRVHDQGVRRASAGQRVRHRKLHRHRVCPPRGRRRGGGVHQRRRLRQALRPSERDQRRGDRRDRGQRHRAHLRRAARPDLLSQGPLPQARGVPHARFDHQGHPQAQGRKLASTSGSRA